VNIGLLLKLHHEYSVYMDIAGCAWTSSVLWYAQEDVYEVIVLGDIGNSFGELTNEQNLDCRSIFSYALQMVCL
jgi:hypothetical protein